MKIQKTHQFYANLPTIVRRSLDYGNFQSCTVSPGGWATPSEKINTNEKFLIKNLSKEPIEYEQQSNISILLGKKKDTRDTVIKYKDHFRQCDRSNIKRIRLSRSEQLLSKAKEVNNKHFNFKLRGLKSQSHLQPSKYSKIMSSKQNINLVMQKTLPNFDGSSQQRLQELRKYKKRNFVRCKWFVGRHG